MTELITMEEKEQNSTGDGTIRAALLSDGSKTTKVHLNSNNERRLIANFKDRSCCISVFLFILLIISFVVNIYFICKEKQSCISVESCQNITTPQKLIDPDNYNCSSKPTGNGTTNVETILKLELWKEELKIVVQLPINFILHKFSYDKEREIMLCKEDRNHYYISCNKPYNDNCTIIYENVNNTSIQEAGDRMLTYEIPTNCIDGRAVLEWIQPHKCMLPKPKN